MDPKSFVTWSPESLAEYLIKGLPDGLREPCKARIISNGVTGQAVLDMIRELCKPGSVKIQDHATFHKIFDKEWDGNAWRHWGGVQTIVRRPEDAMHNFFMKLFNENASVVVKKAQTRIFEIIDPGIRAYEFDAYYSAGEAWCIASGQQALVQSQNGGGQQQKPSEKLPTQDRSLQKITPRVSRVPEERRERASLRCCCRPPTPLSLPLPRRRAPSTPRCRPTSASSTATASAPAAAPR